jgi:aldehyde dehydrogenase (NAD+)
MEKHCDELAALEALDNGMLSDGSVYQYLVLIHAYLGKTFGWAKNADLNGSIFTIKYYAGWADKIL